jgi:histidinol-phosphate aminotransferase
LNTHHQSNKTSFYSPDAPTAPRDTLGFHGDSEIAPGLVDLAVNVRPDPLPDWLRVPVAAALDDLARYPDAAAARAALAARHGRTPAEVLTTAGAAQGFVLLARALRVRRPVVVHPQFTEAEAALVAAGHRVERVLLPAPYQLDPDLVPDDADLVVVGNPTNPTSVLHPAQALARLARPGRVLVVDEAFADTVPGEPESLAGRADLPGLVVLRSLTKTWGLAGLRIGYLLAAPDLVELLAQAQPLWPVSTPALAAAVACADRRAVEAEQQIARGLTARRTHLVTGLQTIPGVRVAAPPSSSFVLIEVADGEAVRLALRQAGFAVRRGDTFPGLGPDFLRIAVRETATTDAFLTALARVIAGAEDPVVEEREETGG